MRSIALFILITALLATTFGCTEVVVPEAELSHYLISAEYDEATRTLRGTETVEFVNSYEVPVSTLAFRLYGNAFRTDGAVSPSVRDRAYYKGESEGGVTVDGVTVDGAEAHAEMSDSEHALTVALAKEVFPGEKTTVKMNFTLTLAEVISRLGVTPQTVNLTHWYPELAVLEDGEWITDDFTAVGDPFYAECAVYDVSLTVPTSYVLATSGKLEGETKSDGKVTRRYSAKRVRDFAVIASDKFKTVSALSGSTLITYYSIGDTAPEQTLRTAQNAMTYFSDRFGTYPYPSFALVEAPLIYSGMEYSCLAVVDNELVDKTHATVHETAHQWWSQIAGNNQISHAFFDEGLAEYSTALYYGANGDSARKLQMRENAEKRYVLYLDVMNRVTGKTDSTMARDLDEFVSEYEYEVIAYSKGHLLFDNLALLIGEDALVNGLKRLVHDMKYKTVDMNVAVACIEKGSCRRIEGVFNAWVDGRVSYYLIGALEN